MKGDEHEFDVRDSLDVVSMGRLFLRYKWLIVSGVVLGAATALVIALTAASIYRAEVTVTDARSTPMVGLSSLVNQVGGLAGLAGMSLGASSGGNPDYDATLESRRLMEEFVKRNHLVTVLVPAGQRASTLWFAVKRFKESVVSVHKDVRKATTSVAMEWGDPITAAAWANGYVSLANELIRTRAIEDANRDIAYLNQQVSQTTVVDLRKVMYDLIENETKTLMLASGRPEYAFEVVDPAVPPELRDRPHRAAIVLIGAALGLFSGMVSAFIHSRIKHDIELLSIGGRQASLSRAPGETLRI